MIARGALASTLLDTARRLAELDVGALPICGEDDRLKGMITDRDIVVKALAQGKDPGSTRAGELGQGDSQTVTVGADDPIDEERVGDLVEAISAAP